VTRPTAPEPPLRDRRPVRRFVHPEPVDLRTAWEAEQRRATAPGAPHHWCDDQHGWLLRAGLDRVLEPVLVPDDAGSAAFYRFGDLGAPIASDLLERLPAELLATERQNDGPTLGAVLRAVADHPDHLRAHGYVIGPGRCDERITVEGVVVRTDEEVVVDPYHSPGCRCEDVERAAAALGVDDAAVPPHEISRWRDPARLAQTGREHWYRLWWD
jgi:hypothetical protein